MYAIDDIIDIGLGIADGIPDLLYNEFASKYLMVVNKDAELVPFVRNRLQCHFYEARQESDKTFHLIIKPRQGGISTDMQGEQVYLAATERVLGLTLADDDKNAAHMRDISKTFYDNLPEKLGIKRSTDNSSTTSYLPTGAKIRIGPATRQKGRSGTYTFFHGSEVAFWKDAKSIITGAMQGLVQGGLCVFETTANGAQGWVWDIINNPGKWEIHFYAWWWVDEYQIPLLPDEIIEYTEDELRCIATAKRNGFDLTPEQIKWRRYKKIEVGQEFEQEYPETLETAFLKSGGGVFDASLITFIDDCPEYIEGHVYAAGIDWGQDNDYTVLSISDRNANRQVSKGRWRKMPWAAMRAEIVRALVQFHVTMVRPERNSMGSSQIESLWSEIESAGLECELMPFTMGGKNKHELITFYRTGLEDYGYALLDDDVQKREHITYETKRTTTGMYSYSAPPGGHDDYVIADALSYIAMMSIE